MTGSEEPVASSRVQQRPMESGKGLLRRVSALASDPTGTETFGRYRWQVKQAVVQWLTCLRLEDPPVAVLCEWVEDITVVLPGRLRFAQLKTRDKGSWSARNVCDKGHGIDALIRSYVIVRDAALHEISTFELWLEGPAAATADTTRFFEQPATAGNELRKKLRDLGLPAAHVDDFLARLVITPRQQPRESIDAHILQLIGSLWPSLTTPEREAVYATLLDAAQAAQAKEPLPAALRKRLLAAVQSGVVDNEPIDLGPIQLHALTAATIRTLTPPLPSEGSNEILARIAAGEATTALELKMRAAGVTEASRARALALRAQAEVERQLVLASRLNAEEELAELAERVLTVADANAARVDMSATTNPGAAARPGEAIVVELLSRPGDLAGLDSDQLFSRNGLDVFGFLCHLSDLCRFSWRRT